MRAPLTVALGAFLVMLASICVLVGWNWILVGGHRKVSERPPVQFRVQIQGAKGESLWVPMGTEPPRLPDPDVLRRWQLDGPMPY